MRSGRSTAAPAVGDLIRFPAERCRPPESPPELVQEPHWFGVRLRPEGALEAACAAAGASGWCGTVWFNGRPYEMVDGVVNLNL